MEHKQASLALDFRSAAECRADLQAGNCRDAGPKPGVKSYERQTIYVEDHN
jgi:hypothetical protein